MRKKVVTGIMLTLLLLSMLTFAFNILPVKASFPPIFIRADGSIEPPTAPIQRNGDLYTLTDNIASEDDGIVIERNDMTLDGAGYAIECLGDGRGIGLSGRSNVTVKNVEIKAFTFGIYLASSNSTLTGNTITNNTYQGIYLFGSSYNKFDGNTITNSTESGIYLDQSSNNNMLVGNTITFNQRGIRIEDSDYNILIRNTITNNAWDGIALEGSDYNRLIGNTITNNSWEGILLYGSNNYNMFYHNNFIDNPRQVYAHEASIDNVWDDGYPSGGNYWSDYNERYPDAEELDGSGIWDTPYVIDENNQDNYPLMRPFPETTICIDPTPVSAYVCENFTVALNIREVTDLWGWQVKLSFDPTLLECLSVTEGPFLRSSGPTIPVCRINNTAGTILACCVRFGSPPGSSGSGTLAYIQFHCEGLGECDLVFFPFPDTYLLDSYCNSIPHTAVNGHVHQETMKPLATEWTKTYGESGDDGAYSVVQTSDGGYAIAGYTDSFGAGSYDFWLVKVGSSGNLQWNKTYGGNNEDWACSVVQTSDGGYALAGTTGSFGAGSYDLWLVKVGSSGNHQWNKTYGGSDYDGAYSVVQTSDGGYAMAGYTSSFGTGSYDFWLVKVGSSGNQQWNKTYGGASYDYAKSVVQTSDGGYALTGTTRSFGAGSDDFWLVKVDSSGNHQWNKTYGGNGDDWAYSVVQTSDGGYALAGATYSFGAGSYDFWLVKVDSSGNHQWNKTYGGSDYDEACSVVQASDGGYALAGCTYSFEVGNADFWLVKVDSSGNHQWNGTYGGSNDDYAYSVVQTLDGGYALAGCTAVPDGPGDVMLVKVGHGSTRYPWPMFRHNLRRTGYTESPAPNTNQTQWIYMTGDSVISSPVVVNGRLYVGSWDNKVYCLDATTGAYIWNYTTGGGLQSSPAVADGKVYIGSMDNKTYCLDATTGELIWSYTTGNGVRSSPAVANGRVYVGSYDNKTYCLDASTGELIWSYTTDSDVRSSPAVAYGRVYVGSMDGRVYCFDASTGELIWNYTTGGGVRSCPAVVDGRVYVGSTDNKTYCLDAATGALIWNYTTDSNVYNSPAVAYGRVYVGSWGGELFEWGNGRVYCLDAITGEHIWNYTTGGNLWSSPTVADGKVYIGSWDNKTYCLDASTGELIWSYTTGHQVWSSPAVADGMVFIGSLDGNVYAFGNIIRAEDYPTIQAAIDDADPGATIIIAPGTYYNQSLIINKTLTIIGLPGSSTEFKGGGSGIAITLLPGASGTIITGIVITNWDQGIFFANSSNCKIYGNIMSLMNNSGIALEGSSAVNNRIYNNIFQGNNIAINLTKSSTSNIIYHNNFIANNIAVHLSPGVYVNIWDNGYPSGGNYWSDYSDVDLNSDGIWDHPYVIDANNTDRYPLVKPFIGLAITRVTTSKTIMGQGFTLRINVTILNHGVDDEASTITIYANTTIKASLTVTLTNRNFTTITLLWNTAGVAMGNYTITVKATSIPGETDLDDNTLSDGTVTVTWLGDLDGDLDVDQHDYWYFCSAFIDYYTTPSKDPNCDFDDDCDIDQHDLWTFCSAFIEYYKTK